MELRWTLRRRLENPRFMIFVLLGLRWGLFHVIKSFWSDDCCWSTWSKIWSSSAYDWLPPSLPLSFPSEPSFPPSLTLCLPQPVNLISSFHITLKVSHKCALFCRTYWRYRYSDIPVSESSSKRRTQGLDLQRVSGLLLPTAISLLILLYCYFFSLDCHT